MPQRAWGAAPRREARAFYDAWTGASSARARTFQAWVEGSGNSITLDGSPVSLVPAWGWLRTNLRTVSELHPDDHLPEWAVPGRRQQGVEIAAESLWLVDGFAHYYAQVMLADVPSARWRFYVSRTLGSTNAFHQLPVIVGRSVLTSPLIVVGTTYRAAEQPESFRDDHVLRMYASQTSQGHLLGDTEVGG